jgi:hypothetical protein
MVNISGGGEVSAFGQLEHLAKLAILKLIKNLRGGVKVPTGGKSSP